MQRCSYMYKHISTFQSIKKSWHLVWNSKLTRRIWETYSTTFTFILTLWKCSRDWKCVLKYFHYCNNIIMVTAAVLSNSFLHFTFWNNIKFWKYLKHGMTTRVGTNNDELNQKCFKTNIKNFIRKTNEILFWCQINKKMESGWSQTSSIK